VRSNRYPWPREQALALLATVDTAHFALTGPDGLPLLRCLHVVLDDDALCFHASLHGQKSLAVGKPAVAGVERKLAVVPSYAFDPERACPATTWYQSVQVRGLLERVEDPHRKARVLQKLMTSLQPEGGHVPIAAEHPLYRKAIDGIDVLALPLTELEGRAKLGQNRNDDQVRTALTWLWRRGNQPVEREASPHGGRRPSTGGFHGRGVNPEIDTNIEAILDARPELAVPEFLRGPAGTRLCCRPHDDEVDDAVALVAGEYWNTNTSRETLRRAHLHASVWVGARDDSGRLIATARASTDAAKHAWIYDVAVDVSWRGRGVGAALLELMLDHPSMREVAFVHLQTRDAERFYARFGFVPHPGTGNPRYVRIAAANPINLRPTTTNPPEREQPEHGDTTRCPIAAATGTT
jgi:GNAT superfamily N-acetyltransferase/nitroimidazol reductase NimA-like FMN-containing flavoprotein (pyridoxamine 5'-phosphate oxidase superfamily)